MSKIEIPFHIKGNPEFRFSLVLESNSVNAHSLMDSSTLRPDMERIMDSMVRDPRFMTTLERHLINWKEKHK